MKQSTIKKWQQIFKSQEQSGKSIVGWCKENKISVSAFFNNRKKIRDLETPELKQSSAFQQIMIKEANKQSLKLYLTNQIYLELKPGFNQELLKQIIEAIRA